MSCEALFPLHCWFLRLCSDWGQSVSPDHRVSGMEGCHPVPNSVSEFTLYSFRREMVRANTKTPTPKSVWLQPATFTPRCQVRGKKSPCKTTTYDMLFFFVFFLQFRDILHTRQLPQVRTTQKKIAIELNGSKRSFVFSAVFPKVILFQLSLLWQTPPTPTAAKDIYLWRASSCIISAKRWQGKELWLSSLGTLMQILSKLQP